MKKILSLILTLLVSITGMTCLTYAEGNSTAHTYDGNKDGHPYKVTATLTDIEFVSEKQDFGGYFLDLKPTSGNAMPSSVTVVADGKTLDPCITGGYPSECAYTYNRKSKNETSTVMLYDATIKAYSNITITAGGVNWSGEVRYTILDGVTGTSVKDLFYNVGDGDYVITDSSNNYTNTFGIIAGTAGYDYSRFGMYLIPDYDSSKVEVKVGDNVLVKCDGDTLIDSCDYIYTVDRQTSGAIFADRQNAKLKIKNEWCGQDKTINVTIKLDKKSREVFGTIKNGYFNGDTTKTGTTEIKLGDIYKADYINENYKYTVKINTNTNYELPDSIKVYVYPTDTHKWTLTDKYTYDSKTGVVKFNSDIFDYNEKFLIEVENTYKEEEKKASIVTCEDANGKGWIWSESKKACVYKVSNTSTKG